jgi:hypothetical protein
MKRVRQNAAKAINFHERRANTKVTKPATIMKGYPSTAMGVFSLRMAIPVANKVERLKAEGRIYFLGLFSLQSSA